MVDSNIAEAIVDRPALRVRHAATEAHLLLHLDPEDAPTFAERAGIALGDVMLRTVAAGGWNALHLAPDEWLLVGPIDGLASMSARSAGLAGIIPHSLVDVTDRNLGMDLSGTAAPELLAAGCPLDLDSSNFPTGSCSRTLFGKVAVMLRRTGDEPSFRLEYARSFAGYVTTFLALASEDVANVSQEGAPAPASAPTEVGR